MAQPRPGPKPAPTAARCGWPVKVPNSSTTWRCNAWFGHDSPHALYVAGTLKAEASGFTLDDR